MTVNKDNEETKRMSSAFLEKAVDEIIELRASYAACTDVHKNTARALMYLLECKRKDEDAEAKRRA